MYSRSFAKMAIVIPLSVCRSLQNITLLLLHQEVESISLPLESGLALILTIE